MKFMDKLPVIQSMLEFDQFFKQALREHQESALNQRAMREWLFELRWKASQVVAANSLKAFSQS